MIFALKTGSQNNKAAMLYNITMEEGAAVIILSATKSILRAYKINSQKQEPTNA
ncbi:MAG: hypothetical protein ABI405_06105 [Parafilimonas sp.]